MILDTKLFDELSAQAKANPRLRQMFDLRNSPEDSNQRFLNALEPGTVLPVHRHPYCNSIIIVLRGAVRHYEYDDEGNVTQQVDARPPDGVQPLTQIEKNKWHNLECLESGTVIFEFKDAKYNPETDTEVFTK